MHDAEAVISTLLAGAGANDAASCRRGAIDVVEAPGRLIATGDIHDNPGHLAKLVGAAGLGDLHGDRDPAPPDERAHLTLHEIIHPDTLSGGIDFSYRALVRVAWLKARFPEHVHVLLANHELAQMTGSAILKKGVKVVEAFDAGLEYVFADRAEEVARACATFVRSMVLALRCRCPQGDILCAHSLPAPGAMARFDTTILGRALTPTDYQPRVGSAHLMVWGRGYDHEQLEDLTERWGVNLFILGHEHHDGGYGLVEPNCIVLNSDHRNGVYLPVDLGRKPRLSACVGMLRRLAD